MQNHHNNNLEEENVIDVFFGYLLYCFLIPFLKLNEWKRANYGYCLLHERRYMSKLDAYASKNPNATFKIKAIKGNKYQTSLVDEHGNHITNICKECPLLKDVSSIIKAREVKRKFLEKFSEMHGQK